jgi:uncharacterized membrane protein YhaH (DUF805 family)
MNLLFSFFGRTGRGGFWLGILCSLLAMLLFVGLGYLLFGAPITILNADGTAVVTPEQMAAPDVQQIFNNSSIATGLVGYALGAWMSIATQVKRCHDRGFSGWWIIPMNIVPFWSLISLGVLEGQDGPNVYGPDPRGATAKA